MNSRYVSLLCDCSALLCKCVLRVWCLVVSRYHEGRKGSLYRKLAESSMWLFIKNMTVHEVESAILVAFSCLHHYNVLSIDRSDTYAVPVQNPSGEEVINKRGFLT